MIKEHKHLIKLQRFPMEQIYLKCVRVRCYQKLSGADEDIDNTKTEDIDNTKTEDIDNTKTEAKDEDIHRDRNIFMQVFRYSKRWVDKKGNWKKRQVVWVFWDDGHVSELN